MEEVGKNRDYIDLRSPDTNAVDSLIILKILFSYPLQGIYKKKGGFSTCSRKSFEKGLIYLPGHPLSFFHLFILVGDVTLSSAQGEYFTLGI
jgi:hypothetical protein